MRKRILAALVVAGFLAGIWLARRRAKPLGMDPDVFADIGVRAMIAGIVGSRLFYVVQNFGQFRTQLHRVFYIHEGGLVFFGGLLAIHRLAQGPGQIVDEVTLLSRKRPLVLLRALLKVVHLHGATACAATYNVARLFPLGLLKRL